MADILIIEDEADLAELYRLILEDRGHRVVGLHEDPQAALLGSPPSVDLILLDERLGRLSGSAFMEQFRKAYPSAKIALVSADPVAVAEGRARGADLVLKKPVPLSQLLDRVAGLLT